MTKYQSTRPVAASQLIPRDPATVRSVATWLIPQIAERSKAALDVIPEMFYQFNLKRYRKCSCFQGSSDPSASCLACFGEGYLPGYVLDGFYNFIGMDVTEPGLIMVNVAPDFSSGLFPTPLQLISTALTGYIESPFLTIGPNKGSFSKVLGAASTAGINLLYSVDEGAWEQLIQGRYSDQLANATRLKLRVEFSRDSLSVAAPFFQVLHTRIQVAENPLIELDVPRWVRNLNSTDSGLVPLLETFNSFANKDVKADQYTLWMHQRSNRKFKVLSINPNIVYGTMTSWDMQLRMIQPDEALNQVI